MYNYVNLIPALKQHSFLIFLFRFFLNLKKNPGFRVEFLAIFENTSEQEGEFNKNEIMRV